MAACAMTGCAPCPRAHQPLLRPPAQLHPCHLAAPAPAPEQPASPAALQLFTNTAPAHEVRAQAQPRETSTGAAANRPPSNTGHAWPPHRLGMVGRHTCRAASSCCLASASCPSAASAPSLARASPPSSPLNLPAGPCCTSAAAKAEEEPPACPCPGLCPRWPASADPREPVLAVVELGAAADASWESAPDPVSTSISCTCRGVAGAQLLPSPAQQGLQPAACQQVVQQHLTEGQRESRHPHGTGPVAAFAVTLATDAFAGRLATLHDYTCQCTHDRTDQGSLYRVISAGQQPAPGACAVRAVPG